MKKELKDMSLEEIEKIQSETILEMGLVDEEHKGPYRFTLKVIEEELEVRRNSNLKFLFEVRRLQLPNGNSLNYCQTCARDTVHLRHGFNGLGELHYMGHSCPCGNWYCSRCDRLSVGVHDSEHCRCHSR